MGKGVGGGEVKPLEAENKIFVMTEYLKILISYYKLLINHFPIRLYEMLMILYVCGHGADNPLGSKD